MAKFFGREYVCSREIDLYKTAELEGLVTQAAVGRHLQRVEIEQQSPNAYAVMLCEDDYSGWISAADWDRLAPAEQPYCPIALNRSAIEPRLPEVIAFTQRAMAAPNTYLWGGTVGPNYDCSGLMQAAFASMGIRLPRDSYQQEAFTQPVSWDELIPGDLIFFGTPERTKHVALYLGEGNYIHSSGVDQGRNGIGIDSLTDLAHPVSAAYHQQLRRAGRVMTSYCPSGALWSKQRLPFRGSPLSFLNAGLKRLKPLARWGVVGAAIAFLLHTLVRHWADISALRLGPQGWSLLLLALGITLLAHTWAGWVWSWALQALQQPITGSWSAPVYLQTNLLKYLPGNVWHFFGRVRALRGMGVDNGSAIIGVALEPLLMAAAALVVGIATPTHYWPFQLLGLVIVLAAMAPHWLNPIVDRLGRSKTAHPPTKDNIPPTPPSPSSSSPPPGLRHYPLKPLLGQIGYVALRGVGFCLVLSAVTPLAAGDWPSTISAFSLAWLGGLVVPGAPGGLGVFEAIALSLLQGQFSAAVVLSAVVLYRVVSTLAEALGAALATLDQSLSSTLK